MTTNLAATLLAALAAASAGAPATAPSDEEVKGQVEAYLGSIDTPIPAERFRALGPRAATVLAAVSRSPAEFPTRRARAVAALASVGGGEATAVARELALAEGPFVVRAAAVESLGRLLSPAELAAAVGPLMRGAREAGLRAVAAETLARGAGGDCAAVRSQVAAEAEAERGKFHRALSACSGAR